MAATENYSEPKMVYLTPSQAGVFEKKRIALGWPDEAKFLRKLIAEGLKNNFKYQDPDGFHNEK